MMFGDSSAFAIEIGLVQTYQEASGRFVQFRFWISGRPLGDWDDRIPLDPSIEYATTVVTNSRFRRERFFQQESSSEVFREIYDAFFDYDYTRSPLQIPNLRDRYHLGDVGLGAVLDNYGMVLVDSSQETQRVLVKDLHTNQVVLDISLPTQTVECALLAYVEWGRPRDVHEN